MNQRDEAEQLLQRLKRDPDNGPLANDLLQEIFQGHPVESLLDLIHSGDERLVKRGIWLASELGAKCHPILKEVSRLLDHPSEFVRYYAIDCMLTASRLGERELVQKVVSLLHDSSSAVRRKVMDFLARIEVERLSDAMDMSVTSALGADHVEGIGLIVSSSNSPSEIREFIESDSPIRRRYGASAAARIYDSQTDLLHLALESSDEDLRTFAKNVIALSGPRHS